LLDRNDKCAPQQDQRECLPGTPTATSLAPPMDAHKSETRHLPPASNPEERNLLGRRARGYLCIASATLFWGISASLGRAVFTGRLKFGGKAVSFIPPLVLAQSRTTIAFLILLPILLILKGRRGVAVRFADLQRCLLLGIVGLAGSNFFYYYSIQQTTVATAITVQYVAPVMVLLYMLARGRQRPTVARISGVVLAVFGIMLAIGVVAQSNVFPWLAISTRQLKYSTLGVVSALVAALAFSFWNVYSGALIEATDRWRVTLWALFGAATCWILINPPAKLVAAHYQPQQWLFMLIFAICSSLVPFTLYLWGLEYLDPTRAIVTGCLEPVFAILIAALTLGEIVGPVQVLGIGVVLLATVLVQIPDKEKRTVTARAD